MFSLFKFLIRHPLLNVTDASMTDQHALMKQVSILNKQLALLRANQVSNPQATQTLPLDNITNVLNSASNLLP